MLSLYRLITDGVKMSEIELANRAYQNGLLNPEVSAGKGTIIEYVVLTVMGDCVKESFNFPYDLTSKRLHEINVKSSSRHESKNGNIWTFSKKPDSYIPDHYVCVGLNETYSKIIHVWEIPGSERVVGSHGIYVIDTLRGLKRVAKYEVDPEQYNDVFQRMDISSFPEFENVNNYLLKQNMGIAHKINEENSIKDIEAIYGFGSYAKYLEWVLDAKLKQYFNLKTGSIGLYQGTNFLEITKEQYPVYDPMGKFVGYIENGRLANYFAYFQLDLQNPDPRRTKMKVVMDAVKSICKTHKCATSEQIKRESGFEDIDDMLKMFVKRGSLLQPSPDLYKNVF